MRAVLAVLVAGCISTASPDISDVPTHTVTAPDSATPGPIHTPEPTAVPTGARTADEEPTPTSTFNPSVRTHGRLQLTVKDVAGASVGLAATCRRLVRSTVHLIEGSADGVYGGLSMRMEITLEPGQLPLFEMQLTDPSGMTSEWEIHGTETPDVESDGLRGRIAFTDWGQASSGPGLPGGVGDGVRGDVSWTCVQNPGP